MQKIIIKGLYFLVAGFFIGSVLRVWMRPVSEIPNRNIPPQIADMQNRSWSEEDRDDWVILSKTELISGLHLKKVYARRLSDNFVHSIFTEKEYPINSHVKVAWVHHRMSYSTKQNVDLPIILIQCN